MGRVRIALCAGGTGGHLFPAQALAEVLIERGYDPFLITDRRGVRFAGSFPAPVYTVASATLTMRQPVMSGLAALKLMVGVISSLKILWQTRPQILVGFGGYPTVPPALAARIYRIPTIIHEANAVLGRVSRWISGYARAVSFGFPPVEFAHGKNTPAIYQYGNPLREAVLAAATLPVRKSAPEGPFNILICGGSQGAVALIRILTECLPLLTREALGRLHLHAQCPRMAEEKLQEICQSLEVKAEISAFFDDIAERMARSDLIISRAGASSVSEIAAIGRPSILIPLPTQARNDQSANATHLAKSGGALVFDQSNISPEKFAQEIERLMGSPADLHHMAKAAKSCAQLDAAMRLADLTESYLPATAEKNNHRRPKRAIR